MPIYFPHLLSFIIGFVSLSLEILWVRVAGFAGESTPRAFSFVIMAYLVGIALGAWRGKILCNEQRNFIQISANLTAASILINCITAIAFIWIFEQRFFEIPRLVWSSVALVIAFSSAVMASLFPIVHHLSNQSDINKIGSSVSYVYASNIAGATLGPLFTGYLFLAVLGTQGTFLALQLALLIATCYCLIVDKIASGNPTFSDYRLMAVLLLISLVFLIELYHQPAEFIYSRIAQKVESLPPDKIIETRHGIISIYKTGQGGDIVYGNNVYDGRTNTNPAIGSNGLDRITILSALIDKPKRVLVIGLSIGSWLSVLESFPGVETIDVVELNDGYLKAIENYPEQSKALEDGRVKLYITDAVRWMRENPSQQYDLIIMNTTWSWRSYTSNLLSKEMMESINAHLIQGHGLMAFNTTVSPDAHETTASVFPYTMKRKNFVIAGNYDFIQRFQPDLIRQSLLGLKQGEKTLYPPGSDKGIEQHIQEPLKTLEDTRNSAKRRLEVITMDNMISEYKYGRLLF